ARRPPGRPGPRRRGGALRRLCRGPRGGAPPRPGDGLRLFRRAEHHPGGVAEHRPRRAAGGRLGRLHRRGGHRDRGPGRPGLAGVELGAILALSPELNEAVARVARREPCEVRPVPVRRTMNRLRASDVWRSVPATLDSEKPQPVDVWRNGCWRLFRFDGRRYGRPVHVVFAVELHGRDPQVRAAVIDIGNGATLAVLGEIADDGSTPLPRNRNGVPQPTNTVLPRTPRRFPGRNIPSARRSRDRIADTGSGPGQPN